MRYDQLPVINSRKICKSMPATDRDTYGTDRSFHREKGKKKMNVILCQNTDRFAANDLR